MKNSILFFCLLFSTTLLFAGPKEKNDSKKKKETTQKVDIGGLTLYGRPASYANGLLLCGEKPGICAVVSGPVNDRVQVAVQDRGRTSFSADASIDKVNIEGDKTGYRFRNVKKR